MTIEVTVAYAAGEREALVTLHLADGASVADAVAASGIVANCGIDLSRTGFAIFGRRAVGSTPLADGDRVELTRPLVADARSKRRQRANDTPRRVPGAAGRRNR